MTKHLLIALCMLTGLAACSEIPPEAYFQRGTPESLLDVSSEVVNFGIASDMGVDELAMWVEQDQPTRAELYCSDGNAYCAMAQDVLDLYGVPTTFIPAAEDNASLIYERVLARDCQNRYIDNHTNPYHLNHPTFGCSMASNMVQMVSDKHQFVSPNLMDFPDARKGVQNYRKYLEPTRIRESQGVNRSVIEQIGE